MKNSVLDNFPPCPPAHPPWKVQNFIFIVVSLSLSLNRGEANRGQRHLRGDGVRVWCCNGRCGGWAPTLYRQAVVAHNHRERKLNPNFFFPKKLFGQFRDIPVKSRDIPPKQNWFSPGFRGHTELFGPHPFVWRNPTPPENIRAQKFRFGFVFRAWNQSKYWLVLDKEWGVPSIGRTPRGSCDNTLLRRVLRRFWRLLSRRF